MCEVDEGDGVDVGCCEEGLVMVAVVAGVDVGGVGCIADAGASSVAAVRMGGEGAGVDDVADGIVEDAAVVIVVRCLAFDVTVGGGVVVLGNLCLLRLRYRGRIAVSDS